MHLYNVRPSYERISIDIAGLLPWSDQGTVPPDGHELLYQAYVIPKQEASTMAEQLVTNSLCRPGVPWELQRHHKAIILNPI
jgi:hypothetical protein